MQMILSELNVAHRVVSEVIMTMMTVVVVVVQGEETGAIAIMITALTISAATAVTINTAVSGAVVRATIDSETWQFKQLNPITLALTQ